MECAKKVQYFTFDAMSSIGIGKPFGMLVNDNDVSDYIKSCEEGIHFATVILALGLGWLTQTPWLGRLLAPSKTDSTGFGKMVGTCFRHVDERVAQPTDARDMLASFMRHGLEGEDLRLETVEQILAGSDTTSAALQGALLYIITNPRVQAKLQHEIDETVNSRDSPLSSSEIISYDQAKHLAYLQAVIREALRVWPPVVSIFSRDVPPAGDNVIVNGKPIFLPGGVSIGYSGCAMHYSKVIYGEDAKSFRPERWFEKDPEKLAAMVRTNELTFGHGKWQCLGKSIAKIELTKFIFEVNSALELHNLMVR